VLRLTLINLHQRCCPTTFVLLDAELVENQVEEGLFARVSRLFHALSDAVSDPVGEVNKLLRTREYVSLLCEECFQPQRHGDKLGYEVSCPKEVVSRILPLAKVGLKLAVLANGVSALGRVFGLPTPVLEDQTLKDGAAFLAELGRDQLEDYAQLEQRVQGIHVQHPRLPQPLAVRVHLLQQGEVRLRRRGR
jgi:hypothetical protein